MQWHIGRAIIFILLWVSRLPIFAFKITFEYKHCTICQSQLHHREIICARNAINFYSVTLNAIHFCD